MKDENQPADGTDEQAQLLLLKKVRPLLSEALNSLGGKLPPSPEAHYLGWAAVSINRAADGFLYLRESTRVDASKLLVRPALEAIFAATAVLRQRGVLFRKAYSEWEEDKKMFAKDPNQEKTANEALENLKRAFQQSDPNYPVECKRLTVRQTAEAGGLLENYESAYRTYCQFTHGALRTTFGNLGKATDLSDSAVVVWCVLVVLDLLQNHTPASVPDLTSFWQVLQAPASRTNQQK